MRPIQFDRLNEKNLIEIIETNTPSKHHALIHSAIKLAKKIHKGEKRFSGEDFYYHPLNVAAIIAELQMDVNSIIIAVLHNTLRSKNEAEIDKTLQLIARKFGTEVSEMIMSVYKVSNGTRSLSDPDTISKFILTCSADLRMVVIKLADRLDNARTIDSLPIKKRRQAARNLMSIYSPLCVYLNLYEIKTEIEEIAFRILEPEDYKRIDSFMKENDLHNKEIMSDALKVVQNFASELSEEFVVYGRLKGHYSTFKKLKENPHYKDITEINDLIAFTVLTQNEDQCYELAKQFLQKTDVNLKKYADYIGSPKPNGYRTLKVACKIPSHLKYQMEVQIKTFKMHHFNTYGPASHIAYKLRFTKNSPTSNLYWVKSLHKSMFDYLSKKKTEKSIPLTSDVFKNRIFVFTLKGELTEMPVGSTPIDFAYRLHSDIGNKAVGCKVDGIEIPLDSELTNGQWVEIITDSKQLTPPYEWLRFVRTRRAREAIENEYRKLYMGSDEDFVHVLSDK